MFPPILDKSFKSFKFILRMYTYMKNFFTFIVFCIVFSTFFTFNASAQTDKDILLDVPVIDYATNEITISGTLDDYTYSMWNNSRITLYVVKNGVEPAEILLDDSVLFNIAEFSPEKDGTFSYTFEHQFKESFDRCRVYVNYSGYNCNQISYSISDENYNEILSDRVIIAVNSPVYYNNGEKYEAENIPYYYEDDIYIPSEMISPEGQEGTYMLLSDISGASYYEEGGIICIGDKISDDNAMILQPLFGLHVSIDGNDTLYGMNNSPVKTIARALELYKLGAAREIFVHQGVYEETILLDEAFSGITLKGIGEVTVKTDPVKIPLSEFKLVQEDDILSSLPHTARGKVLYADFPDCNIEYPSLMGSITKQNESYYKVYQNGTELTNARYPNGEGFTIASGSLTDTEDYSCEVIYYDDTEKLTRWNDAKDARVSIFRMCGYNMSNISLIKTDVNDKSITLDNPTGIKSHQVIGDRFFVYNLIQELDIPGEWYIDRENERIYVFPIDDFNGLEIATSTDSVIKIDNADNVLIENINFERTRGTGIEIRNADTVNIKNCNVDSAGKYGIFADGVTDTIIDGCEVSNISKGGIYVNYAAYHDPDLKVQNNIIQNCDVYNIGTENFIAGGIYIGGTGNKVSGNTIHDTPHMAIWFDGNDNTVEYNEIYNALKYCDDAGIIYSNAGVYGFGSVVQYNYIHDCPTLNPNPTELYMIYLDYTTSGTTVKNNIFDAGDNLYHSFGLFGGGRNNVLDSNIFIGDAAFVLSNRYQNGAMHDALIESAGLPNYINSLTDSQKALWFEKYHAVEEEYKYYINGDDKNIGVPRDCEIKNNIFCADYYGTLSSDSYESDAEYFAFFKKKASAGFNSTKNNGVITGNTYVTEVNLQEHPAMNSGRSNISIDADAFDILYPQNNMMAESGKHRIVWNRDSGAEKYIVKVYSKDNVATPVFETETTNNFADAELTEGRYSVEITGINADENKSCTSEFECKDIVLYSTSGSLENIACDAAIYVSVPAGNTDITPELFNADDVLVESTTYYENIGNRRIIRTASQKLLAPEKTYTLVIANDIKLNLKTNKLCTAKSEFKDENGSMLTSVKLESLLERTAFDFDVFVAGKTTGGTLESIRHIPVTLTPQQSKILNENVNSGLNAEVYVWNADSSLTPLTEKMSVND